VRFTAFAGQTGRVTITTADRIKYQYAAEGPEFVFLA